ncbi:hypothetical protein AAFC00_000571 [Neodothiora populina]|uniref:AMP-dependent synthetase/ligase domain-containing protein n=1 Tax=Neodothiora populina TaxID=2781224 RepID=A0ABR3PDR1_9PEZI
MANAIEQLDAKIAELLASWNGYTTVIAIVLAAFVIYPLLVWEEADTHPLLLARQAQTSPVRYAGESAVYRSAEVPYGYPLRTGLNVRTAGAPKWTAGRDGDFRDIWREFVMPTHPDLEGSPASAIMTIHGSESAVEHGPAQITKAINVIGKLLQQTRATRVAIYLPNSVEYLSAVFACAFYGLSPILIPYNQPHDVVLQWLNEAGADALIAGAGSLPLLELSKNVPKLSQLIWVVEKSSRHMDWDGTPESAAGNLSVAVWHDLLEQANGTDSTDLPTTDEPLGSVTTFWQEETGGPARLVEFTQKNLISAIAAMISAIPARQRLNPSDLVLPADTFSSTYVLCQTMAALFQHASLVLNSVAGPGVDLALASRGVSPTVIIASSETLANLHSSEVSQMSSGLGKLAYMSQVQAMRAGRMPGSSLLFRPFAPKGYAIGNSPGKLRLIFASAKIGAKSTALTTATLSDLRIITRSRICYALTAPTVAGAISQTNLYDYRTDGRSDTHFGALLSSVEVKLTDKDDRNIEGGGSPKGEIVVMGPAICGGETKLGVRCNFRQDCTLGYA